MVARVVKLNTAEIQPGAVATAQQLTVQGKTQGPCDYLILDLHAALTATAALTNGLLCGVDRVEVQIDASADQNAQETGSIFYTLYGGRDCAAAYAATCVTHGMLETVSRMLFHVDVLQDGVPLGTTTVHHYGAVIRLPLGKNVPVTVSVTTYIAATARWCAAAWVYTGGYIRAYLYGHLVDSVADLKIRQTTFVGLGPQQESPLYDIPDAPGYWFVGYALDIRVTAGAPYVDRLGGGALATIVTHDGWARIQNGDGQIFDQASGAMIKADMFERNSPINGWVTVDLWSTRIFGIGQYSRLMAAPIEAKTLKLQLFPHSAALATDIWRVWYIYSKQGAAIKQTNAQQPQTTNFGAAGAVTAQETKR